MAWARLDDTLPVHPKVRALSDAAFRLYICAICWSNLHLTDGYVPSDQLRYLSDVRRPRQCADQLIQAGLWEDATDGWRIHDYLEYQPSAEKVQRERAAKQQRQTRWRSHGDASRDASPAPSQDASSRVRAHPIPSHPPGGPVSDQPPDRNARARDGDDDSINPRSAQAVFDATRRAIKDRTGRTITDEQADVIATRILGSETIRNPAAYIAAAINRDPNPRRFLPSELPPPPPRRTFRPDQSEINARGREAARMIMTDAIDKGTDTDESDTP